MSSRVWEFGERHAAKELWCEGIVSAPLWDSKNSTFAGLLTTSDYINLIQYYWQNPEAVNRLDQFKLSNLRGEASVVCNTQDQSDGRLTNVPKKSKKRLVFSRSKQSRSIHISLCMKLVVQCWIPKHAGSHSLT